ncbi:unnamed protein product [Rotaria sp. Silwood1]|nr:unnamed protein product [Rotaria sp. Silwood1]
MSSKQWSSSLRIMTYNIREDVVNDGKNQWKFRKDRVIGLIRYHSPDIFGVQEALYHQLVDLQTALTDFSYYGVGRDDGKDKGEFSAIFYLSDRFELLNQGTFWLSQTPNIPGSKGWDATFPRICSWVKINDRRTPETLYYFNTHLERDGETARREGARLVLTHIQEITGLEAPIILTGDFNAGLDSDAYLTIITDTIFQDAKCLTETPHYGPSGSKVNFDVTQGVREQIDHIFVTPSHFRVLKHANLTDSYEMCYPSDHLPVLTELIVKERSQID